MSHAYTERDFLVSMLSFHYPAVRYDQKTGGQLNWVVVITTPSGPLSFTIHDDNVCLVEHITPVDVAPENLGTGLSRTALMLPFIEGMVSNPPVTSQWVKKYVKEHLNVQATDRGIVVLRDLEAAVAETEVRR